MTAIPNFPMVSQRTTVTSDGKASENALYDCVAASIGAAMLWLEGKSQWDDTINPDKLKDAVYGDAYTGGTAAVRYVDYCKSQGFNLHALENASTSAAVAQIHELIKQGHPVIYTELDPYVDTNLPQYADWTHVCVFFSEDSAGLTAMDPFIAQPVYKSDATWTNLLRSTELWLVERIPTMTTPTGWQDDGTTMTAPNGVHVVHGFRAYVLANNWDPANWPLTEERGLTTLELSNPSLGGGTQQLFRWTVLEWTQARGVFVAWVGQEVAYYQTQYAKIYEAFQQAQAQIQQLETQLQQAGGGQAVTDIQAIKAAVAPILAKY